MNKLCIIKIAIKFLNVLSFAQQQIAMGMRPNSIALSEMGFSSWREVFSLISKIQ
jgi:hypothetical protein